MSDANIQEIQPSEQVSLTLRIDAPVYEAFLRKAQQAGLDVETFLSNTLTIVMGCRAFNERQPSSVPENVTC